MPDPQQHKDSVDRYNEGQRQRADGGANIVMKHSGIQTYPHGRPKTLMEQQVDEGRRQMEMYARDQADAERLRKARDDALEEAAKVAEAPIMGHVVMPQPLIAAAIRALKEKAHEPG